MKRPLSEQLKDGRNGFVKTERKLKIKHDLADLLSKQNLKILNMFVLLSTIILTLQSKKFNIKLVSLENANRI